MRNAIALLAVCTALIVTACSPTILYTTEMPEIRASGKTAILMIVRPAPLQGSLYNAEKLGSIYLDGAYEAATTINTTLMMPVEVGTHYVMSRIDNVAIVKLSFMPGKTYFCVQTTSPVPISAPTQGFGKPSGGLTRVDNALELVSPEQFDAIIKNANGKIRYTQNDTKNSAKKSMGDREKKDFFNNYEYWAQCNPDKAKKQYEYTGY